MSIINQPNPAMRNHVVTGLEAKLANFFQLWQGMMQELLTGRIRLI
ncbi:hypothetical protein PJI16_02085 [Nitrospira sp. MA-1]|nr:hypothetical protein [Nitrospira sp. MA-1]